MYSNGGKDGQNQLWTTTQYYDFSNVGDYNSTYKFNTKRKPKELKVLKNNSNIDVKVRK